MKKKALAVFLALSLCVCLLSGVSFATGDGTPDASAPETGTPEPDGVTVNMTVSAAGELVLVNQPVAVTDVDGDGALTVRDALTIAHDTYYEAPSDEDGAKPEESDTSGDAQTPGDGEDAETPEDGENAEKDNGFVVSGEGFITKLWGVENGGSYGYYVNHVAATSITDPVADGDYLAAYTFADLEAWSDLYTYFESVKAACEPGSELALKLSGAGYDEEWNPVVKAVAGAKILVNGEETELVTDENGAVTVKFDEAGTYTVSAVSEEGTIVPPVCVVTVAKSDNGDPDDTPDEVPAFTDIAGHWGEEAIKYTAEKGYLMGISDTEFAPDVDVSRAMIVTVLYRIEGEPEVKAENPFTDLEDNTWYTDAVLWAAENELVLGYNDTYRAGDTLTRREAALILYRWAQFKEYELAEAADLSSYEDAGTVDDWALEAMAWACGEGVITGTSETTLAPRQSLTRAQLALMLMRLIEK